MEIGILYIAVGNYYIFFKEFYETAEMYFQPEAVKHYYVFTDYEGFSSEEYPRVSFIYQKNLGWPHNTLMRYHMFYSIREQLSKEDYLYFFNANAKFVTRLGKDILPDEHSNLIAAIHPGYKDKKKGEFPYERNVKSTAFLAKKEGDYYYQGCFFGGKTSSFLDLISTCMQNIDSDLKKNIIAIWHDESHLNKYLAIEKPKVLDSNYIYPEDLPLKGVEIKILMRDKRKYGGHNSLRGVKKSKILMLIKKLLG